MLRRSPRGCFEGQPQFARQIDAAVRLAPVEAHRGHAALLLSCGNANEIRRAQVALHELWPLDVVHALPCPIGSWAHALEDAPGTASWLQHYVMREVQQRGPSLLAILARGHGAGGEDTRVLPAVIGMLRVWGATSPIAALRIHENQGVEWLVTPALLEETG
jgi:hypothetical protein